MRWKYVEERFPRWFVFGESADGLRCDLNDGDRDVLESISRRDAAALIGERDRIVDAMCEMAMAFYEASPEAFDAHWYGTKKP
jgi:hypothetical protein